MGRDEKLIKGGTAHPGKTASDRPEKAPGAILPSEPVLELAARLEGIASSLPGFAFQRRRDVDGAVTFPYISANVTNILGFDPQSMGVNAQGCPHVVHWADREEYLTAMRRSAERLETCIEEFRAVSRAGEVRWLKGASRPRRQADGTILWDGVLIDVTEGRRAEFRLDMLMEHAVDSILILDETGSIDTVNAAAETLFGWGGGELAGRPFQILLSEADREPGLLDIMTLDATEGLACGVPRECVGLRKSGGTFPLELSTSEVRLEGHRLYVCIGRDITARKATEAALRESEQRLRAIAGNMPGMVFQRVLRHDGRLEYTYVSEGCRDFLGVEPEELMADAQLFLNALSTDEGQRFLASLGRSARTMEPFEEEMAVLGRDRKRRWLRGQSRPTRRDNGDVVWDGVIIDVTDRKVAEQRLSFLAYYDPLTRLPNRAAFLEGFVAARERAVHDSSLLAVLSLGIDRFGIINATMGHAVGDQVLVAVADLLQSGISRGDVLARASGDRFLMLISGHSSKRELTEVIERVHVLAQTPVSVGDSEFGVSTSIGAAVYPRDGDDAETLIKNAEAALQRAKGGGAGNLQIFTKEMSSRAAKTLTLQSKLRRGLENGEFLPYFQPQVDLQSGAIVGMEALVRWNSPEMGMVAPGEFIPVAEESGIIDSICEVMLSASARQNKEWQDQGLPPVPVAVNVSGRQFQYARRLITALENTLKESGLEPQYLEIELTESSAMRDAESAIAVVQELKDMGIDCAIDDFGTGYSSLSVLKRFPISKLKIDRSFVMDITTDPNDAAIVDAIVAMAKALKMKVVAEGVEHGQHLEFLRNLGCEQMQGYLFSRPVSAADMGAMLREGRRLHFNEARRLA